MANKDPSKTEKPTGKCIARARDDGNVLFSSDINSLVLMIAGVLFLFYTVPYIYDGFRYTYDQICAVDCRKDWGIPDFQRGAWAGLDLFSRIALPGMLVLCGAAILIMRIQVGKYFSLKPIKWKFDGFNFQSGLKSLLPNKQNNIRLLITIGKVAIVGGFVYVTIKKEYEGILSLSMLPFSEAIDWIIRHSLIMVAKILALYIGIAALDYLVKHKQYYENLMMTKQEVKDERKDAEGDPRVKAKIRQKMRELFFSRMLTNVPKADVIVTNPTHVAVALQYDPETFAPKIVAKGLRKRAERIKELARMYGIPIVEAPPLARSLYRNTKVGAFISPQFYGAVAAILARIQKEGRRVFISKSGSKLASSTAR